MLTGEPGIGKTRLAEQLGTYAGLRGAQTLVGQCHETEAGIPYLPFVDALRQYVAGCGDDALRSELGSAGPDVAKLVSEVTQRLPDVDLDRRHPLAESLADLRRDPRCAPRAATRAA